MIKTAIAILFGVVLMTPAIVQPVRAEEHNERRYYDRDHKDYHVWNEGEQRAYQRYQQEKLRENQRREWQRTKAAQQRQYWQWRHEHPDTVLFPDRH